MYFYTVLFYEQGLTNIQLLSCLFGSHTGCGWGLLLV